MLRPPRVSFVVPAVIVIGAGTHLERAGLMFVPLAACTSLEPAAPPPPVIDACLRERFGRGGSGGGGINRYPDVSGRTRPVTPPRDDRNYRPGDRPCLKC